MWLVLWVRRFLLLGLVHFDDDPLLFLAILPVQLLELLAASAVEQFAVLCGHVIEPILS